MLVSGGGKDRSKSPRPAPALWLASFLLLFISFFLNQPFYFFFLRPPPPHQQTRRGRRARAYHCLPLLYQCVAQPHQPPTTASSSGSYLLVLVLARCGGSSTAVRAYTPPRPAAHPVARAAFLLGLFVVGWGGCCLTTVFTHLFVMLAGG